MKRTAWRVPLIEAPDGTVWGFTSCPDVDIDRWMEKPEASPYAPTWGDRGWGEP
jgi:hypothetical protein